MEIIEDKVLNNKSDEEVLDSGLFCEKNIFPYS